MDATCDERDKFGGEARFGASIAPPERSHMRQIGGHSGAMGVGGLQG